MSGKLIQLLIRVGLLLVVISFSGVPCYQVMQTPQ